MPDKLHYAENGVHQCWTCRNCVGQKEFVWNVTDAESVDRKIIFVLPECKVADRYMTWVTQDPCSHYVCNTALVSSVDTPMVLTSEEENNVK